MAPTRKGRYDQCIDCKFKLKNTDMKYPCEYSHKIIRKSCNIKYERDFTLCGKYEKME